MEMEPKPKKLLDQVRDALRLKHHSIHTEPICVNRLKRSILFHHKCHPAEMGATRVKAFLTHLKLLKKFWFAPRRCRGHSFL